MEASFPFWDASRRCRMLEATAEAAPQFFLQTFVLVFLLTSTGVNLRLVDNIGHAYGQTYTDFFAVTCKWARVAF